MMTLAPDQQLGAAADLGLGDDLRLQVESEILDRKKKSLLASNPAAAPQYGATGLGTGLNTGSGNFGLATQALLGSGGFHG